jgi:hypothetical protein
MKIKNYKLFFENLDTVKYNIGDYIFVTTDEYNLVNKILIIYTILDQQDVKNNTQAKKTYICNAPNIDDTYYEIEENDIIGKASDFEIKASKYNL